MRIFIALAACLALATAAGATAVGAQDTKRRASLRLIDRTPVRLKGTHFYPAERVRVRATAGTKQKSRTLRANGSGTFVTTFAGEGIDRCNGFEATADGNRGSHASLKLPQLQCPPLP